MDGIGSSRTSPPTSTSWFTSDRAAVRLGGLIRLVHPFPSLLDGAVVGAVALVAEAPLTLALVLGSSMTTLQFAIGALNDLHDAPTDAGRRPPKPIPAELISADAARVVLVVAASIGLSLAATAGTFLLLLAALVLVIGFGYDLAARGTTWSWLPFAVGIPILPVYGWLGATGELPPWAVALVPAAAFAGAAIAVANARADEDRDRTTGVVTVATSLGDLGSRLALLIWWGGAATITIGWLVGAGADVGAITPVALALAVVAAGVALGWAGRPERREWGWRIQAVGAALAAVTWLLAATRSG